MSWIWIVLGVIAAFLLLFTVPILGLFFLFACVVAGSVMWIGEHRPNSRPCPVCGEHVRNGVTTCGSCGYDFRAGAAG